MVVKGEGYVVSTGDVGLKGGLDGTFYDATRFMRSCVHGESAGVVWFPWRIWKRIF